MLQLKFQLLFHLILNELILHRLKTALSNTQEGVQQLLGQLSYDKLPREIEGMTGLGTEVQYQFSSF